MCCNYGTGGYKILSLNGVEQAAGGEFGASEEKLLDTSSFCGALPTPAPTPPTPAPTPPTPAPTPPPTPPAFGNCDGTCSSRAFVVELVAQGEGQGGEDVWKLKEEDGVVIASGSGYLAPGTVRRHQQCIG